MSDLFVDWVIAGLWGVALGLMVSGAVLTVLGLL